MKQLFMILTLPLPPQKKKLLNSIGTPP